MSRLAEIADALGVTRLEARRIISARVRETLTADARPRTTTAWTDDEILEALRVFVAATGRLPRKNDFDPHGTPPLPSRKTIGRRFGTLAVALDAARVVEIDPPAIEAETPDVLTLF